MGLRYRQSVSDKAIYFVTTSRIGHRQFPDYPDSLQIIQEIIFRTAVDKFVSIMGYVLMPNHLHLLVKTKHGGNDLSRFVHSIKGRIRETLVGKDRFWQERYDDFMIRMQEQFSVSQLYPSQSGAGPTRKRTGRVAVFELPGLVKS